MKKQVLNTILCIMLLFTTKASAQSTVDAGQTTEGKDFWFTFMQADQKTSKNAPISYEGKTYNALELSMSISSREDCRVYIENPYTGYLDSVDVIADERKLVPLYSGVPVNEAAREKMGDTLCYSYNSERVDSTALHIWSTKDISLFATNYKRATFDATNVLPSASLQNEYIIQTYTPSDHEGSSQGSHFAIVAVEDSTVVTYILSAHSKDHLKGDTVTTPALKAGQVWYVWTGQGENDAYDLSGTRISSNKKIAVFQGCPHTNIPYKTKERDHIFSQAMPIQYWGNTFVLTSSGSRKRDFVRIMALNDETTVYINGDSVYTFDFANNPKQYWEFEFGDKDVKGGDKEKESDLTPRPAPDIIGDSCYITTSCPCAVHLFMASRQWDGNKSNNGDPAMLWVNPIEQQIDKVTFATYDSSNGTSSHYVNIVTDHPGSMYHHDTLMNVNAFKQVSTSPYYYIQYYLGSKAASHTIRCEGGKFIAHVYGFTANESYGYSAGGATVPLTQYITINGEVFTPDSKNTLCGEDTVHFACHPDYEFEDIEWHFGDDSVKVITYDEAQGPDSVVPHYYAVSGTYDAYVLIRRKSSNVCVGQNAVDSIPITVTIGRFIFSIDDIDVPCPEDGQPYIGKVLYTNEGHVNLHGDNVTIEFDETAKADGFKDSELVIEDSYFQITIPSTAKPETNYGIHLVINSDCGGTDTTMTFALNYDKDVITQRSDNVLALLKAAFNKPLSDFQWYRASDSTAVEGQITSVLNFYDLPKDQFANDSYYVCFTVNKGKADEMQTCACAKTFKAVGPSKEFQPLDSTTITATYVVKGNKVFVNADYKGETDIECYAQWITVNGKVYKGEKFDLPDGGCTIPAPEENGFYILRVVTGKEKRSFKMIINK